MVRVLFIVSNIGGPPPNNLGDIILARNLIKVFGRSVDIIVDDHYLTQDHCKYLGVTQDQFLSSHDRLPNPRNLRGILQLLISHHRPYDVVLRLPASIRYQGGAKEIAQTLFNLLVSLLLRSKGIKVFQFGMTCNPLQLHGTLLWLERAKSRMYAIYSVRDIGVYNQLKLLNFRNLFYCPDIFYWSSPQIFHSAVELNSDVGLTVLISLRESLPDIPDQEDYTYNLEQRISAVISSLHPDIRIIFSYQVPIDYEFNRRLYKAHKARGNCRFVEECLDIFTTEDLYLRSNLIISNRQHCLLYGAKLGTPMLALTDTQVDWKLSGALQDLGMTDYLADIHEADKDIIARCNWILENEDLVSNQLIASVDKKRQEALTFLRKQANLEILEE